MTIKRIKTIVITKEKYFIVVFAIIDKLYQEVDKVFQHFPVKKTVHKITEMKVRSVICTLTER